MHVLKIAWYGLLVLVGISFFVLFFLPMLLALFWYGYP